MRRLIHVVLTAVLVLLSAGVSPMAASAQEAFPLDLANIPLPTQDLPESGYQVLTGSYLTVEQTVDMVAQIRNSDAEGLEVSLGEFGVTRSYVLDLVLPVDRADENADILAVVQTVVYQLDNDQMSEPLAEYLVTAHESRSIEYLDAAVPGAYTIGLTGVDGKQIRTVVGDGDIAIEIGSLDATGDVDATEHALIVEATLERLAAERGSTQQGVSTMTMTLAESDAVQPFSHSEQSGVHGIYRIRDGQFQEAIGEMIPQQTVQLEPGLLETYVGSNVLSDRNSITILTVMMAGFETEEDAQAYLDVATQVGAEHSFVDPYFSGTVGEEWVPLADPATFRVTGTFRGDPYSGFAETRVEGTVVFLMVYRVIGASAPSEVTANGLADYQQQCIAGGGCEPVDLESLVPASAATPLADGELGSAEYGWRLEPLGDHWTVTEQFSESGYDRLALGNGNSLFELESVVNHHGDPVQCVLDQKNLLQEFEERAYIRVYQDPDGSPSGGNEADHAWIVYQVEPLAEERADQEYVTRIDCYALPGDAANLVVTHTAPIGEWSVEREKGDELRESIILPESSVPHGKLLAPTHDRRTTMIDAIWMSPAA